MAASSLNLHALNTHKMIARTPQFATTTAPNTAAASFHIPRRYYSPFVSRRKRGGVSSRTENTRWKIQAIQQTDSIDASFEHRLSGPGGKGGGEDDDDEEEESEQQMQLVLSKLKVPDLKSELEKRKLKKTGKKQELVDRLVMALERERKSLVTTKKMMLVKEKEVALGEEESDTASSSSSRSSSREKKNESDEREDDDDDEDMTTATTAATSPPAGVQHAKVRRRVVRRGGGISDATASSSSSSKKGVKKKSSAVKRGSKAVNGNAKNDGSSVTAMMPSSSFSSSSSSHIIAPKYNPSREAREKQNEMEFVADFEKAFKTLRERLKLERLKASSDPETKLARMFEENKMEEDNSNSSSSSSNSDSSKTNEEKASDRLRRLFTERRQRGMRAVKRSFNEGEDAAKLDAMTTMAASIVDVEKMRLGASSSSSEDEGGLAEMMSELDVREALDGIGYALEVNNRVLEGYNDSTHGLANNSIDPFKLVIGEYVVHRKYGIGKFLGMRSINHEDEETGRNEGTRKVFLFIQFADDTAKIEPKKASMHLYRYASPGAQVKPPRLSKLYDKLGSWEAKEAQMQKQIRDLVVHQMCVYLQRLQCVRAPYSCLLYTSDAADE